VRQRADAQVGHERTLRRSAEQLEHVVETRTGLGAQQAVRHLGEPRCPDRLPNRIWLDDGLHSGGARGARRHIFAVAMFDLDASRLVNDSFGTREG